MFKKPFWILDTYINKNSGIINKIKDSVFITVFLVSAFFVIIFTKNLRREIFYEFFTKYYHRYITCKLNPHIFLYDKQSNPCYCKKCGKLLDNSDYHSYTRLIKIKKLKKLSKKK